MKHANPGISDLSRSNAIAISLSVVLLLTLRATAETPLPTSPEIAISTSVQQLEMRVNTSRMLTLEHVFSRAQVTNPDVLQIHPISPYQLQVVAKTPGSTQINLHDSQNRIHAIDVSVTADVGELDRLLKSQFPRAVLQIIPLANSVVVGGYVNRADDVDRIIQIAEDYCPRVINNITVSGAQQVLLHVRVMEVSRTKLREHGIDLRCGIVKQDKRFLGFLSALQKNQLVKVLAEPTLVTISGRSASFRAGGEFPVVVPGALGTNSIEYKTYGTEVDFVPNVLANGRIRLEVRPRVSELDLVHTTKMNKNTMPSLKVRQVDTGVEMQSGQTLALAGLIQNRVEAENRALPILGKIPYIGAPFRHVAEKNNEIELLIMVTPEIVEPLMPHQVPPLGPGMNSASPRGTALYLRGEIEVPSHCSLPTGYAMPNGEYESFVPGVYEEILPRELPEPQATSEPNSSAEFSPRTQQSPFSIPARYDGSEMTTSLAPHGRRATRIPPVVPTSGSNRPLVFTPVVPLDAKDVEVPGLIGPLGYDHQR